MWWCLVDNRDESSIEVSPVDEGLMVDFYLECSESPTIYSLVGPYEPVPRKHTDLKSLNHPADEGPRKIHALGHISFLSTVRDQGFSTIHSEARAQ